MIRIHHEGKKILFGLLIGLAALNLLVSYLSHNRWVENGILSLSLVVYILVLQFFRNPRRSHQATEEQVIAPADGKVVAIEEIEEPEYFKEKMLQISIFMSPLNVHVNRYPISGIVRYVKYHPGAFLVAWHPKSSTLNERTTVVIEHPQGSKVMYKQIAGALARRILYYPKENDVVAQGADSGFIRFGSRVDVVVPTDSSVLVKVGEKVRGGEQIIAELK